MRQPDCESFRRAATAYKAAPMIEIFQPLITNICEVPVCEKASYRFSGMDD